MSDEAGQEIENERESASAQIAQVEALLGALGSQPPKQEGGTPADMPPVEDPEGATEAELEAMRQGLEDDPLAAQAQDPDGNAPEGFLDALQKTLTDDPEAAYGLKIKVPDGSGGHSEMTLGELKNSYVDGATVDAEKEREAVLAEHQLNEREAALIQDQQLVQAILDHSQESLPQDLQAQLQDRWAAKIGREKAMLQRLMPELQDDAKLDNFRKELFATLQPYGFKPSDMNITDHRLLVVMRDFMRNQKNLKRLLDYKPKRKPSRQSKGEGRGTPFAKGGSTGNMKGHAAQAAAVSALISGEN